MDTLYTHQFSVAAHRGGYYGHRPLRVIGGMTYIIEQVDGIWKITNTREQWIS